MNITLGSRTIHPGFRTSEWVVTLGTIVWYIVNAWQDWLNVNKGVAVSAPAIAYIISRGLAKYETRNTTTTPPTPPVG